MVRVDSLYVAKPDDRDSTVITLTTGAADRLRGRWTRSFDEPSATAPNAAKKYDLIDARGAIAVRGVQLLDTGWVRAHIHWNVDPRRADRIDLLLAPGEVVAIHSETVVAEARPNFGTPKKTTPEFGVDPVWRTPDGVKPNVGESVRDGLEGVCRRDHRVRMIDEGEDGSQLPTRALRVRLRSPRARPKGSR